MFINFVKVCFFFKIIKLKLLFIVLFLKNKFNVKENDFYNLYVWFFRFFKFARGFLSGFRLFIAFAVVRLKVVVWVKRMGFI